MAEWNKRGIPHKGWYCKDVFDLREDAEETDEIEYEQCEMCGNEKIRFVHVMKHPEYNQLLHVGRICAEKMSNDYINPGEIENELRKKAFRRSNFKRVKWKFNEYKNTYSKKYKGEYITIKEASNGNWAVFFAEQQVWKHNGRNILSFEVAEKVAFEIFEKYHTTKEERENRWYNENINF